MDVKKISDKDLAYFLRTLCSTGISPTRTEREILQEAADRLAKTELEKLAEKIGVRLYED